MSRAVTGTCHLCGTDSKLSFEHVPPKKAFNQHPVIVPDIETLLGEDLFGNFRGKIQQRGVGGHTLCIPCNNDTGSWYGSAYVDWTYQGMKILYAANGTPTLSYSFHLFPLRVIKQIICCFFSVNPPDFRKKYPDLERFALSRERKFIPPEIKVYVFYNLSSRYRQAAISGMIKLGEGSYILSEFTFPPFGYVMTMESRPPDRRLCDISFFADFRYDEFRPVTLNLPVLPVFTYFPADYRDEHEVKRDVETNSAISTHKSQNGS